MSYTNSCVCGHSYDNNCAHYLSNWMIVKGEIKEKPSGSKAWCSKGRPIRAKDMRDVFKGMGLSMHHNPPSGNCYIYCERNSDHQGHVYYGTKSTCVAGTGNGSFGADYYEYYF